MNDSERIQKIYEEIVQLKIEFASLRTSFSNHLHHHREILTLIGLGVPVGVAIVNALLWLLVRK